jgi:hypothetical protein
MDAPLEAPVVPEVQPSASASGSREPIPLMDAPLAAPVVPEIQPSATASGSREPPPLADAPSEEEEEGDADDAELVELAVPAASNQGYLTKNEISNLRFAPRLQAIVNKYTPAGDSLEAQLKRQMIINLMHLHARSPRIRTVTIDRQNKPQKHFYGRKFAREWGLEAPLKTTKDAAAYVFENVAPYVLQELHSKPLTRDELNALGLGKISDQKVSQGWVRRDRDSRKADKARWEEESKFKGQGRGDQFRD